MNNLLQMKVYKAKGDTVKLCLHGYYYFFCVIFMTSQGSPYNGLYMLEYLLKAPIALPSSRLMHLRWHAIGNRSP